METTPTLADLIADALEGRAELKKCDERILRSRTFYEDNNTLAQNALNEHLITLIDARITKILNATRP